LRPHCCLQSPCQPCGQPESSSSKGCGSPAQGFLLLLWNWVRCTGVLPRRRTRLPLLRTPPGERPAQLRNPGRSRRVRCLQRLLPLCPAALQPEETAPPGCSHHGAVVLPLRQGGRLLWSKSSEGLLSLSRPRCPRTGRSTKPSLLVAPSLEVARSRVDLWSHPTEHTDCGRPGRYSWTIPLAGESWLPEERSWRDSFQVRRNSHRSEACCHSCSLCHGLAQRLCSCCGSSWRA